MGFLMSRVRTRVLAGFVPLLLAGTAWAQIVDDEAKAAALAATDQGMSPTLQATSGALVQQPAQMLAAAAENTVAGAVAHEAQPQDCVIECPPDSIPEGEPTCYDEYEDHFNGGCGSDPVVFSPIAEGQVICGESGTYTHGGTSYRDTDWYEVDVPEGAILTWEATAEFPVLIFVIQANSGNCADYDIVANATADPCWTARIEVDVAPGSHWLWVGPSVFAGWPCGSEYVAELQMSFVHGCADCPWGGIDEGEPVCHDDYVDETNAGCNNVPFRFTPIQCYDTICGTSGTYIFEGSNYRDTDWMEFTLDFPTTISWEFVADFPVLTFLIDAGSGDCVDYTILDSTTALSCELGYLSYDLQPGTYWLWMGPQQFSGIPCGWEWWGKLQCGVGECPGGVTIARAFSYGDKFSFAPEEGPLVDARMPWPPDSYEPLLGIGVWNNIPDGSDDRIIIEMTEPAEGLEDCFSLIETDSLPGHPNSITGVGYMGQGRYRIQLDRPITPDACTTIWYEGDGSSVQFIGHPANINADSVAEAFEVLLLIDYLNGISDERAWGEYSSDIDHSATTDSFDVLRAIDLLSGESPFYAPGWANTELPECGE
jgi:hypothetical protein